jgi:hypothetical protein
VVSFVPQPLYPQGKIPWYPFDRRLGWPQSRSGRGGEEKNSQPLPRIELLTIPPVAQLYTAELFRLTLQVETSVCPYCCVSRMPKQRAGGSLWPTVQQTEWLPQGQWPLHVQLWPAGPFLLLRYRNYFYKTNIKV